MKNIWKHTILFTLFLGGPALFVGCDEDEKVNLAGYPETPVGLFITGLETPGQQVSLKAVYDGEGKIVLNGPIARTYAIKMATPSPEDITVYVEPTVVNIPQDKVVISDTQLKIPAGSSTALVTVGLVDDDFSFARPEYAAMDYEIGLKIVDVKGYQTGINESEAKVLIAKEAYVANFSVMDDKGGRTATFIRAFWDGEILNEDQISYTFKAYLDRPALKDVKVKLTTTGLDARFAGDVTVTPSEIIIPVGEVVSPEITWTVTDDFLLTTDESEEHELAITVAFETDDATVKWGEENAGTFNIDVLKQLDALEVVSGVQGNWSMFDRSGWTAADGNGNTVTNLFNGSTYDYSYGTNGSITIDMLAVKDMVGFAVRPYASSSYYAPSAVEISISDDGTNWESIGSKTFASKSSAYYFKILGTIPSRYLKFNFGGSYYLSEIEVYGAQ